ncbi:histidine phosphatase family protein [Novosphingobium profundi]|uniref:histidine phosphatase family protein n=1 Tax=Novosphingobium profundi TaxID=1774954 RepID=UPI0039B0AA78
MRRIHLVRHVPPVRPGLLWGHGDVAPAVVDCPVLHQRVQEVAPTRLVSSDLSRAMLPAQRLAEKLGLELESSPRWRELDFGGWDGLAPEAIDGEALTAFWEDPEANPPFRGERWSQLCARVRAGLAVLEDGALVVTHAGAMRAALSVLTGLDHHGVWAIDLPYRARLTLRIWPGSTLAGQVVGLDTGDAPL